MPHPPQRHTQPNEAVRRSQPGNRSAVRGVARSPFRYTGKRRNAVLDKTWQRSRPTAINHNFKRTLARLGRYQKTGFIQCKRLQFGVVHRSLGSAGPSLSTKQKHYSTDSPQPLNSIVAPRKVSCREPTHPQRRHPTPPQHLEYRIKTDPFCPPPHRCAKDEPPRRRRRTGRGVGAFGSCPSGPSRPRREGPRPEEARAVVGRSLTPRPGDGRELLLRDGRPVQ